MKKPALFLAILLATTWVHAQTLDSIAHHVQGYYGPDGGGQMENVVQMADGNVLFVFREGINFGSPTGADIVGSVLYKMSRHGGIVLDTLFIESSLPAYCLFAKNPVGDGNIRVGFTYDTINWNTFFQIIPFDNDLNFDTVNEVLVPLSDTFAGYFRRSCLINSENDIVLNYFDKVDGELVSHFAIFGLDGTMKLENVIPYADVSVAAGGGFGVFNKTPLEYYICGRNLGNNLSPFVQFHILDSLFQHKDQFIINDKTIISQNPPRRYNFGWNETIVVDGDDFVLCSRYEQGVRNGVCMVRYDKRTLEQKNAVFFESNPMITSSTSDYGACPIGMALDSEGSLFLAYMTQNPIAIDKGQIAVVKTDANFNIIWQRFCLEPEGYRYYGNVITALDDGDVAIGGNYICRNEIFFLIVNDDYDGMEEQGLIVRPYAYYPNPAQDELHLQYSPDVKPGQIELFDIQGRLVRLQRNSLERLNLQGLPTGTYTMRVTLEGGKVFSDKVIKE